MDFKTGKSIFESLYSGVDGYAISKRARQNLNYKNKAHTYGEVTAESFYQILNDLQYKNGGNFYDLGSGTGKAVMLSAIFGSFTKLTGVEIIKELHQKAVDIFRRFEAEVAPILPVEKRGLKIELANSDFLNYDFSDADVIFAHSTCFYDELMLALERKCLALKEETKILLTTKNFLLPQFRLVKSQEYPMTWGKSTVNFYEKD
ncbi:hypothetical protein A2774_05660 [Candidatus Roizmanbacteria bacterium RIFCSPHIGHO2_01_FULL_39_12c]|uniref:Histone-lysine N-methyltransferase, H3 lysine-79 specific n=1 Tax=Candidatus Roizmanbacteria bacterium RIFCSPHIGHO2_01_FULL_39_12c TaxID=1802031 RepID=A0A1F7G897_9BACT|nr:MAG: hypothetical protein A2774_05660 [Candidatus Roizmanbacteria bacterium RIFCSPHIGHO2_01_FULL_39_12c]